eukprot:6084896-Prymnesium_polylepis.1
MGGSAAPQLVHGKYKQSLTKKTQCHKGLPSTSRVPNLVIWPAADMHTPMHWSPCLQHVHSAPFEGHRGRPACALPGCDATRRTSRRRPP